MKRVYRYEDNRKYWDRRWSEAGSDSNAFTDMSIYPIRYAELGMAGLEKTAAVLEIGCGLGRVLKHYANRGYNICGIERSAPAVKKIRSESRIYNVVEGDVMALPYAEQSFDVVMAFGVYHNLEFGIEAALAETARVLRTGGRFVISMRPDNIEMMLNEWYWRWQYRGASGPPAFHKLMVGDGEFRRMLAAHGLATDRVHYARNVAMLYRIPWLRDQSSTNESEKRSGGYRLSPLGRVIDRLLNRLFPYQVANVIVFIGHKVAPVA